MSELYRVGATLLHRENPTFYKVIAQKQLEAKEIVDGKVAVENPGTFRSYLKLHMAEDARAAGDHKVAAEERSRSACAEIEGIVELVRSKWRLSQDEVTEILVDVVKRRNNQVESEAARLKQATDSSATALVAIQVQPPEVPMIGTNDDPAPKEGGTAEVKQQGKTKGKKNTTHFVVVSSKSTLTVPTRKSRKSSIDSVSTSATSDSESSRAGGSLSASETATLPSPRTSRPKSKKAPRSKVSRSNGTLGTLGPSWKSPRSNGDTVSF